jgi:hypothetical protein
MIWSFKKATALVENSSDRLSDEDIATLLDDAYMPRDKLDNPSLLKWFNESDAWWFDNVRFNAERLESPYKRALGLSLGMMVGDYVLSFEAESRQLREPLALSRVLQRMADIMPYAYDNSLRSSASNQDVRSFIAERMHTELLFLRLPAPVMHREPAGASSLSWREEWLHGGDHFWSDLERKLTGRLGSRVQSKQQYLGFVEDLLRTASHIPTWAIAHTEDGFISSDELTETIGHVRKVEAVYSKDFSDVLGVRALIVTATS